MQQVLPGIQPEEVPASRLAVQRPSGEKRRPMVIVAAVAAGCLVGFLILELCAYVYLRAVEGYDGKHFLPNQFDDYKHLQPIPNYRDTRGVAHNSQGFRRDVDVAMPKPADTYRIFLMGGSTAYGLGSLSRFGKERYPVIRNDETIDHYLEAYLAARLAPQKVEVINAAIISHYSHHHLLYLNQTVLKYQPDMVLFLDGYNDYFPYKEGFDQFRDYPYRSWSHLFLDSPSIKGYAAYTGWWLYQKSHLVYVAVKQLRPYWQHWTGALQGRERIDVPQALRALDANADRNFVKMVERNAMILRHEGVIPVFMLQPEVVYRQKKVFTPLERTIFAEIDSSWPMNFVEYKNQARPLVAAKLKRATEQGGGEFLDLTDVFGPKTDDVYSDHCHLTPSGNRALAEAIGQGISPLILRRTGHG
jgi:hypothetical protein